MNDRMEPAGSRHDTGDIAKLLATEFTPGLADARLDLSALLEGSIEQDWSAGLATLDHTTKISALLSQSRRPLFAANLLKQLYPDVFELLMSGASSTPEAAPSKDIKFSTILCDLISLPEHRHRLQTEPNYITPQLPEMDRAWVGAITLLQIINGDFDLVRECQQKLPPFLHLSDRSCLEARQMVLEAMGDDISRVGSILVLGLLVDTDVAYVLMNDLGKIETVQEKLRGLGYDVDEVDHDKLLGIALEAIPEQFPTFSSLPLQLQVRLRETLGLDFNPLQQNQLENLPVSFTSQLFDADEEVLNLKFVESYFDLAGARGHQEQRGSLTLIEPVHQGFMASRQAVLDTARAHKSGNLGDVDPRIAAYRLTWERKNNLMGWGLDVDNPRDYALGRLAAGARLTNTAQDEVAALREAFERLDELVETGVTDFLTAQLGKSGIDDRGVWLYYLPGLLVNSIEFFEKREKLGRLQAISAACECALPIVYEVFQAVNEFLGEGVRIPGEFVVDVESLANLAKKDPRLLAQVAFTLRGRSNGAKLSLTHIPEGVSGVEESRHFSPVSEAYFLPQQQREVLARICELSGLSMLDQRETAKRAFEGLHFNVQAILLQEMSEDSKLPYRIQPEPLGDFLVSFVRRAEGSLESNLAEALSVLARVYQETLTEIALNGSFAPSESDGIIVVDVSELIREADSDLQLRHIEIATPPRSGASARTLKPTQVDTRGFSPVDLHALPGSCITCIGIGGGTDIVSAGMEATLLSEFGGKQIGSLVSIRREKTRGQADQIRHARKIAEGVYEIPPDAVSSAFGSSGRFPEIIAAADFPVFLVIEDGSDTLDSRLQIAIEAAHHLSSRTTDGLFTVDTGGDSLFPFQTADEVGRTTPDLDHVSLLAVGKLARYERVSVVKLVPFDAPDDAEFRLRTAQAKIHIPSVEEAARVLARSNEWNITGKDPTRFGSTIFALQRMMHAQNTSGYTVLPLPVERVLNRGNPWHTQKLLQPSMAATFYMELDSHLAAIKV